METQNTQPEVSAISSEKEFNLTKTVLILISIVTMLILSVMQVMAFATDKTLSGLEEAHSSAVNSYTKNQESAIKSLGALDASVDTVCASYMALKNYKEAKGYEIKEPSYNPCQTMRGFRPTETTSTQQPELKQQEESSDKEA